VPWIHYVPVSASLHNLSEAVRWVRSNPTRAREIVEQAARLVAELHATPALVAYTTWLLRGYAELHATPALEQSLLPLGPWHARFSCRRSSADKAGSNQGELGEAAVTAMDCSFTGSNGTESKSLRGAVLPG